MCTYYEAEFQDLLKGWGIPFHEWKNFADVYREWKKGREAMKDVRAGVGSNKRGLVIKADGTIVDLALGDGFPPYQPMVKILRATLSLLLLAYPVARAQEPAAEALLFPWLHEDAVYRKAVATLPQDQVDPVVAAESKWPIWGLRVTAVDEDTQASKAGMEVGSVVYQLNGKELYHHQQPHDPAPDGRRELTWISPDGTERTFNFAPGRIGLYYGNASRPDLYVFRNSPRGAWDKDLLIAAVAWNEGHHPLAEAALQRAKAAGLPDSIITAYYQAQLAFDHGDVTGARKGNAALLARLPADKKMISRFFHPGLITLALAFQDFDTLEAAVAEHEGMEDELQPATVRKWKSWAGGKPHESLLARALAGAGEELMPKVVRLDNDWSGEFKNMDCGPLRRGGHAIVLGPHQYDYRPFAPPTPVRDAIWEVTVALRDVDPQVRAKSVSMTKFELALVDRPGTSAAATQKPRSQRDRRLLSMRYNYDSRLERYVTFGGGPFVEEVAQSWPHVPLLRGNENRDVAKLHLAPDDPRWLKVTMIRLGDEAEILFDGHTVFRIPLDPKSGDLGFFLHSISTSFVVQHMSLRPIVENK